MSDSTQRKVWIVTSRIADAGTIIGWFAGSAFTTAALAFLGRQLSDWSWLAAIELALGAVGGITVLAIALRLLWIARRPPTSARLVSLEDRQDIERVREAWHGDAEAACEGLRKLLNDARVYVIDQGVPFGSLLSEKTEVLQKAEVELNGALSPSSGANLGDVNERLGAVVSAYAICLAWLNVVLHWATDFMVDRHSAAEYAGWREKHAQFAVSLDTLRKRSSFRNTRYGLDQDPRAVLLHGHRFGGLGLSHPADPSNRPSHRSLRELYVLPFQWNVRLDEVAGRVSVTFRAINYRKQPIHIHRLAATSFRPNNCIPFEDIEETISVDLQPHDAREIVIARTLRDTELRSMRNANPERLWMADFGVRAEWRIQDESRPTYHDSGWSIVGTVDGDRSLPT